jgi:ubiquinone/menaquinone biosynthesis C-methylase UbiE
MPHYQEKFHDNKIHISRVSALYSNFVRNIVDSYGFGYLGNMKNKKTLDYGCGVGELAIKLLRKEAIVFSFDISYKRLSLAKYNTNKAEPDKTVFLSKMNGERLGYKDNSFDIVIGRGILHHLNLNDVSKEIYRVLKPGGKALFIEPLGMNPLINAYRKLTPGDRVPDEKPLSFKDIKEIGQLFSNSGHEEFYFSTFLAYFVKVIFRNDCLFERTFLLFSKLDEIIKILFPFMRRYYWQSVLCLEK